MNNDIMTPYACEYRVKDVNIASRPWRSMMTSFSHYESSNGYIKAAFAVYSLDLEFRIVDRRDGMVMKWLR